MSPAPSMSYWSIFERNLVELVDFAGSNFDGWPTGPVKKSKLDELYLVRNRRPVSCNSPCFDKIETGPVGHWPSVGTWSLQNRPIPLDSSRRLTNSSLRQQGTFFNVPGWPHSERYRNLMAGIFETQTFL